MLLNLILIRSYKDPINQRFQYHEFRMNNSKAKENTWIWTNQKYS